MHLPAHSAVIPPQLVGIRYIKACSLRGARKWVKFLIAANENIRLLRPEIDKFTPRLRGLPTASSMAPYQQLGPELHFCGRACGDNGEPDDAVDNFEVMKIVVFLGYWTCAKLPRGKVKSFRRINVIDANFRPTRVGISVEDEPETSLVGLGR